MNIRFYKGFSKRKNSTKIPGALVDYVDKDCKLKNPTNIENPTIELSGTYTPESATGNPVNISDAAAGPAQSLIVEFTPIQEGSGTPLPSNPRPIVGFTSINVDVNGNVTVIDLQGTKYGGTLDVSSGVLTIKYSVIDLSNLTYTHYTTAQGELFRSSAVPGIKIFAANVLSTALCTIYATATQPTRTNNTFYINGNLVDIIDDRFTDANAFKNAMAGEAICFEVATYQTIQLTPAQVNLVKGTNTITTNGDTLSITYESFYNDFGYDYCYISEFDKYYFVRLRTINTNRHIQYELEEDTLASKKTAIGATVAHIAYSSTGWDKDLTDGRIAVKGTKTIYHDSQALGFDGGCYIIGVVNNDSNGKLGALSYYRMDATNLARLIKNMMQDSFWDKIKQYFNGKTLDFIQSCIWVPVSGSGFVGTMQTTFYVGDTAIADYSTVPVSPVNITHYPVTTPVAELGSVVSLSLGSKFHDFRDNQPYSSASLYLPGVGLTDLNINDFYESASVNVQTIFDITTGDCTYKIYDDSNQLLKTVSFNASASVSLSQVNINSAGAIAGIGGAVGGVVGLGLSAVTMNPVGMATAGVGILAGASGAVMSANQRSTSIKGTNSGRSGFYTRTASTVVVRQDTEDPDNVNYIARCGRPVGQTHAISNHSGYVQCEGASVVMSGSVLERDRINDYLNTGFFYE